jgi:hypothetical protein
MLIVLSFHLLLSHRWFLPLVYHYTIILHALCIFRYPDGVQKYNKVFEFVDIVQCTC